jgi:hypothetical protein
MEREPVNRFAVTDADVDRSSSSAEIAGRLGDLTRQAKTASE